MKAYRPKQEMVDKKRKIHGQLHFMVSANQFNHFNNQVYWQAHNQVYGQVYRLISGHLWHWNRNNRVGF